MKVNTFSKKIKNSANPKMCIGKTLIATGEQWLVGCLARDGPLDQEDHTKRDRTQYCVNSRYLIKR